MTPLVSCVVPAFNAERHIGETIASILHQTHNNIELIVVDDGSTDGTESIVRAAHPDVVYVKQANGGGGVARNHGARIARGEFVAFLDSDDLWLPHKIERQLAQFTANERVQCVLTRVRLFWDGLAEEEEQYTRTNRQQTVGFSNSTMLARRATFDAYGYFREDLRHANAIEWFARFESNAAAVVTVQEVLVEHRMHASSLSRNETTESHAEFLELVKQSLNKKRNK